jgi:hypothetical protein
MDFVKASVFLRPAVVSLEGLTPGPDRDVYLFVKTNNLPKDVNSPDPADPMRDVRKSQAIIDQPGPNDGQPTPNDPTGANDVRRDGDKPPVDKPSSSLPTSPVPPLGADFDMLNQLYPTYTVHAYRDTGTTTVRRGQTFKVFTPQTSFGYYIHHDGDLEGWKHQLDGAQLVEPNLYLVSVPQGSAKEITTRIEAVEGPPFSWWWLLLLLLLILLIWFFKRKPSGP